MDPLSVVGGVASIIQIIDASRTVITYLNSIKVASEERSDLLAELSALLGLLMSFKCRAEATVLEDPWVQAVKCLGQTAGPLDQMQEILGHLSARLTPRSGLKAKARDYIWHLDKKEVYSMLIRLERAKSSLSLALANDFFGLYSQLSKDVSKMQDDVNHVEQGMELMSKTMHDAQRRKIEAWISSYDPMPTHMQISSRRCHDTGAWFFQETSVRDWLQKDYGLVWCPGMPGAGKTFLACHMVDHLLRYRTVNEECVAMIYFNHKQDRDFDLSYVLRGILRQVLEQLPAIPASLIKLYDRLTAYKGSLSAQQASQMLTEIISGYPHRVSIVVDALDECSDQDNTRYALLHELRGLADRARILITSRWLGIVHDMLKDTPCVSISANNADIVQYVNLRVRSDPLLQRHAKSDPSLELDILMVVTVKAVGMFLMAKLHMDTLACCTKRRDLRMALERLPTDLDKTYDDAISRIRLQPHNQSRLAFKVLGILSHVKRPLSLHELQIMVAAEQDLLELGSVSEDDLDDEILLISVSAGLIQVQDVTSRYEYLASSRIVQLAHYTTHDYLHRSDVVDALFPEGNLGIFQRCVISVQCLDPEGWSMVLDTGDFYAGFFWSEHLHELSEPEINTAMEILQPEISAKLLSLAAHHSRVSRRWRETNVKTANVKLSLMSFVGVEKAIHCLLTSSEKELPNTRPPGEEASGVLGPLSWAVAGQRQDILRILLDAGFRNDGQSIQFDPLCEAVEDDDSQTAQLLIEYRCVPHGPATLSVTPLAIAVARRNREIVLSLLKLGISPYACPSEDEKIYLESLGIKCICPLLSVAANNVQLRLDMLREGVEDGESRSRITTAHRFVLQFAVKRADRYPSLPYEDIILCLFEKGIALDFVDPSLAEEGTPFWISDEAADAEHYRDFQLCLRAEEPDKSPKVQLDDLIDRNRLASLYEILRDASDRFNSERSLSPAADSESDGCNNSDDSWIGVVAADGDRHHQPTCQG